jgi:ornithine cyclodeaminase
MCDNVSDVILNAEAIVTATTSESPVLPNNRDSLMEKLVISIGSYRPNMQELPDCMYELSTEVVVDSPAAFHEVGDLINPLRAGIISASDLVNIRDFIRGGRSPKIVGTRIFKSVGYAEYDLLAAALFHDCARRKGLGIEVSI